MSLPLRLSDASSVQTVYNAGISVENMTWWFWIKAGMGFTLGAAITGFFLWLAAVTLSLSMLYSWVSRP